MGVLNDLVVRAALELRGVPYRNGGSDLSGFDCSGFTQYVFAQHGVALPRAVREQFRVGKSVKPQDLARSHVPLFVGGLILRIGVRD